MAVHIKDSEQFHTVRLVGDFDAQSAGDVRTAFSQLVEKADRPVLIDFSEVPFIDSSGIGAIVFLYKRLRCNKQDLVFANLQAQPAELIKLLRIDQIITTQ